MLTLQQILIVLALLLTVAAGAGRAPLWPAVLLLTVAHMLIIWSPR